MTRRGETFLKVIRDGESHVNCLHPVELWKWNGFVWLPARSKGERIRRCLAKTKKTQVERTQTYINFNYSRENECILRAQYQIRNTTDPRIRSDPILWQVGDWRLANGEWNWNSIVSIFWGRCRRVEKKCNKYAYERAHLATEEVLQKGVPMWIRVGYGDLNNLVPTLSKISLNWQPPDQPFLIKVINTTPPI